jgi:hypothetical protein
MESDEAKAAIADDAGGSDGMLHSCKGWYHADFKAHLGLDFGKGGPVPLCAMCMGGKVLASSTRGPS